jgi:signal transduction histidine kinase
MLGKLLLTGTVALPVGAYIYSRFAGDSKSDENIQLKDQSQQPPQPQQSKSTQPRKIVAKSTTSQTQATQNETSNTPTVGAFLPELLKLYELSNLLAVQYEQDAKAYYQVYQEYSEKLEKLIPHIVLLMSKTPLGMMNNLDLPEKLNHFFKYYSWEYIQENFDKVMKGYYILKANGHQDVSHYTIQDLIVASENEALAQAMNQNLLNLLTNLAENYKIAMQSALDQVGKLKDLYAYRLNVLKAQADIINGIINAILDEEKQNFEKLYKTQYLEVLREKLRQSWARLGLQAEELELKREQRAPFKIEIQPTEGSKK